MQKNWLTIVLVIALVGAAYLFYPEMEPPATPTQAAKTVEENMPTAFASNVKTKKFGANGTIDFYFEAEKTEYFQADPKNPGPEDYAVLETPRATLFELDKEGSNTATWFIQSETGRTSNDFKTIELSEQVLVTKPETASEPVEVMTDKLTLETETQYVHTQEPVTLRLLSSVSHSKEGMQAFLKEESFKLFKVRTIYDSQKIHASQE